MGELALFTDVSLNAKLNIGFGAYIIMAQEQLLIISKDYIAKNIRLKKFTTTSAAKLEIEFLLWALKEAEKDNSVPELYNNLVIYTDSQCMVGLLNRRVKLMGNDFKNSKQKELNNAALYREFYSLSDKFNFKLQKVKGHSKTSEHDRVQQVFALVDKKSRLALRRYIAENRLSF